jgi:hypothetical protein
MNDATLVVEKNTRSIIPHPKVRPFQFQVAACELAGRHTTVTGQPQKLVWVGLNALTMTTPAPGVALVRKGTITLQDVRHLWEPSVNLPLNQIELLYYFFSAAVI